MPEKIGITKSLVCSNCEYFVTVSNDERIIDAVKEVYNKHNFVLRDRGIPTGRPPSLLPFSRHGDSE